MGETENIKTGDVVVLKSGGPKMTVNTVSESYVNCTWFNQLNPLEWQGPRTGQFKVDSIVLAKD